MLPLRKEQETTSECWIPRWKRVCRCRGELAEALWFDKSLRLAIESKYVQPPGFSQTENGITARAEFIMDQKNVNIFFHFFTYP